MDDNDDVSIRVPRRVLVGVIVAAVGASVPINIMVQRSTPEVRAKAFTSDDGAALERRIEALEILCASFPMGFQADAPEQMRRNTMEIARFNDRCTFAQEQIKERDQRLAERIEILEAEHKRPGGHK